MSWCTLSSDVILVLVKLESNADKRSALVKNLRLVNKHWSKCATQGLTSLNPHNLEKEEFPLFVRRMKESFVNVVRLQVPAVWIDDECCNAFSCLSQLQELEIFWGDSITDNGLRSLTSNPTLLTLKLYHSRQITDAGVDALLSSKLKILWLYGAIEVTDKGLNALSNLSSLTSLRLMYCNQLTRRGLEPLVKREGLQIFVRYCRRISTEINIS